MITRNQYRKLTGACDFGVKEFCRKNNISDETKERDIIAYYKKLIKDAKK